ncbi:MAG: DUF559 domain-containing protein [Fimbriimonadaceae bacterium]|nr:DUF559 domain-containing protein [Fimbriimonadaceae bacterium]
MRKTKRYRALPYNPQLRARAKELRKAGMLHEALMWNQLKRNQLNGLDFDRQKIIGNYIVDFFCAEKSVVIELDGPSHEGRESHDRRRDAYLQELGLTVIRVPVGEVLQNLEGVVAYLRNHPGLTASPREEGNGNHPGLTATPSGEGNGNHPGLTATPPGEGNGNHPGLTATPREEGNGNHPGLTATPPREGNGDHPGLTATPPEEGNGNHPGLTATPPEEGNGNRQV